MIDRSNSREEEEKPQDDSHGPGESAAEGVQYQSGDSPGQMLRRAREANQLSLDEMVVQTKLSRSTLEAMEADNFAALAEPVFARGYYRRCARVLDMPEAQLLEAYEHASGEPPPRPVPPGTVGDDEPLYPSRNWLPMVLLVVLGCLLVAAIIWWTGQPGSMSSVSQSQSGVASNTSRQAQGAAGASNNTLSGKSTGFAGNQGSTPSRLPQPSSQDQGGGAPQSGAAASKPQSQAKTASKPAARQASAASPATASKNAAQAPPTASGTLHLSFNHDCWVSIYDGDGKRLMHGIVKAGTSRDLKGTPPYRIILGYASGVTMTFNGHPVDLKKHTNGNGIAHLTVGHS